VNVGWKKRKKKPSPETPLMEISLTSERREVDAIAG